ncbi:MAG: zinc ribbon domain-containing protein [Porticoccaceae bacterium]|jgi:putative FmdB family regulatory protein|nr:zinc ribbon domain-containing protein [Porticoccaceae bacterium]
MPIYEYQCDHCGHQFDAIQKFSDAPLDKCPSCEELALRKKISAPSFRLSGSGWYETDFKTDKKKNLAGDRSEPASSKNSKNLKEAKTTNSSDASGATKPVAASKG